MTWLVDLVGPFASTLGLIHRGVRAVEEVVGEAAGGAGERDTDRRPDRQECPVDADGVVHRLDEALGDPFRVGVVADLMQEHGELVAAKPGRGVDAAHRGADALGCADQRLVAGVMAEGVVDLFEPVQVDDEKPNLVTCLIGRSDAEYFQIAAIDHGVGRVTQDGRDALLRPGDLAVYETTRPFRWTFGDDWKARVFTLPRGSVPLNEQQRRLLTARRLDGGAGITGVVSRFLRDLGRHADSLSGQQSERVLADVTNLVLTLLSDCGAEGGDAARSSVQRSLMIRIKDHIDRRLTDPTLGPAEIAAAVNISTRYLHKLFAADHQSVASYVRGLRLERCRRDLLDPRLADQSIATIAFRWGFGDLSGFNRAFKATFGATPRELRGRPSVTVRRSSPPARLCGLR